MLQVTDLIKSINKDAEANHLFWVAGLAVEHYAKADLLNALSDLVTENDKYGGCPCSSPAWGTARAAITKATTLP